jgi:hypothetical protein
MVDGGGKSGGVGVEVVDLRLAIVPRMSFFRCALLKME